MLIFTFTKGSTPIVLMDKDTFFEKKQIINCRGKCLDFSSPKIMGILNITPDSFFDGGKYTEENSILARVGELILDGVEIIDIGAYSSRPGADNISEKEELRRLTLALNIIRKKYPDHLLSVDTFRSAIARELVNEFSINMINDISGGQIDSKMHDTIAELQIPYIIMHMPGTPKNMQSKTKYNDLINDIIDFLGTQIDSLKQKGLNDIIIDPGFGFGKTMGQNYQLLAHLSAFKILNCPVLAGISRKSMIYRFLEINAEESLNGTIALNMIALTNGANILRVHDVKEARQTINLYLKTKEEGMNYINLQK